MCLPAVRQPRVRRAGAAYGLFSRLANCNAREAFLVKVPLMQHGAEHTLDPRDVVFLRRPFLQISFDFMDRPRKEREPGNLVEANGKGGSL